MYLVVRAGSLQEEDRELPVFQTATDPFVAAGHVDMTYFAPVLDANSEQSLVTNLFLEAALNISRHRAEAQLIATDGNINWIDYEWNFHKTDFIQVRLSAEVCNGQWFGTSDG